MEQQFIQAVIDGDLNTIRAIVDAGGNINNYRTQYGNTGLSLAILNRHEDIVKYLVRQGADINIRDTGRTALEWAVIASNHQGIVNFLKSRTQ